MHVGRWVIVAGVALLAAPALAADLASPRWLVSPRAGIWRTDAALAEAATLTPHLGIELGWRLTPRTRLAVRGGWSHLEAARTGRDAELGTVTAGVVTDVRGRGAVRPVAGLSLGYAEDWTTDAAGALQHATATLEAGIEIAGGFRLGVEHALFFGRGATLHGTFLQAGFRLPLHRGEASRNAAAEHTAVVDGDADGVPDAGDECTGTVVGTRVDARGCPIDADHDGIIDSTDLCAATPAGARVDARGCPTDADGDGVVDGLDHCPATPAGTRVDARGCARSALADALAGGRAVLASLRFRSGTADLLPGGESTLTELRGLLIASPQAQAEIAVFTDARGDAGRNRTLAQQRAERIVALVRARAPQLVDDRLLGRGYGEDAPLNGEDTAPAAWRGERVEVRIRNYAITR